MAFKSARQHHVNGPKICQQRRQDVESGGLLLVVCVGDDMFDKQGDFCWLKENNPIHSTGREPYDFTVPLRFAEQLNRRRPVRNVSIHSSSTGEARSAIVTV